MGVVVEVSSLLLEEAGEITGVSEPKRLIEHALEQLVRIDAYRRSAEQRGLTLTEEEILVGQQYPFTVLDTYRPKQRAPMTQEEREARERMLAEAKQELDRDTSLTQEERDVRYGWLAIGGSDPDAVAGPRRRSW